MAKTNSASVLQRKEPEQQSPIEQTVQQVMDLFKVNAVFTLQVDNYYQMSERAKHALCDTLMDITLCKVPARKGNGMWFFLSKEVKL